MKRIGNFVTPPKPRVRLIISLVWSAVAVLAAAQYWLLRDAEKLEAQVINLVQRGEALQVKYVDMEAAIESPPPTAEATRALVARIEYFNMLSGARAASILKVLESLENHVPPEVWLQQFSYNVETGRLQIALVSEQESILPAVLKTLENSQGFSNVILERQIRRQGGKAGLTQYDVEALVN